MDKERPLDSDERNELINLMVRARKIMHPDNYQYIRRRLKKAKRPVQAWRKAIAFRMKGA